MHNPREIFLSIVQTLSLVEANLINIEVEDQLITGLNYLSLHIQLSPRIELLVDICELNKSTKFQQTNFGIFVLLTHVLIILFDVCRC